MLADAGMDTRSAPSYAPRRRRSLTPCVHRPCDAGCARVTLDTDCPVQADVQQAAAITVEIWSAKSWPEVTRSQQRTYFERSCGRCGHVGGVATSRMVPDCDIDTG